MLRKKAEVVDGSIAMNMNTDLRITILGRGVAIDESPSLEVLIPPRRTEPRPSGDSTGITVRGDYREILDLLTSLGPRFQEIQPRHVSLKLLVDAPDTLGAASDPLRNSPAARISA